MTQRVAISVESANGLKSILDPRFGRAFSYVIVDINTNTVIAELTNTARQAAHGAGTGVAAMMANNNVNAVISGKFGPKAFQALEQFGIEMWTAPQGITVQEAIAKLTAGSLSRETSPSRGRGMGRGGSGQGRGRGMGRGSGDCKDDSKRLENK
ncbi:MAG: NifB/NifX family molybdenum-iron cluster-binding protein [Myxococcota bacterium]|nr:NifB/NifX family molybdenum-iron cluster-binding protein [Myxococcota bacterium]